MKNERGNPWYIMNEGEESGLLPLSWTGYVKARKQKRSYGKIRKDGTWHS